MSARRIVAGMEIGRVANSVWLQCRNAYEEAREGRSTYRYTPWKDVRTARRIAQGILAVCDDIEKHPKHRAER